GPATLYQARILALLPSEMSPLGTGAHPAGGSKLRATPPWCAITTSSRSPGTVPTGRASVIDVAGWLTNPDVVAFTCGPSRIAGGLPRHESLPESVNVPPATGTNSQW